MTFLANMFKNMSNFNELIYTQFCLYASYCITKCVQLWLFSAMIRIGSYLPNFRKWGAVHTHAYTNDWHGATGYL